MPDLPLILEPAADHDAGPIERLNERVFGCRAQKARCHWSCLDGSREQPLLLEKGNREGRVLQCFGGLGGGSRPVSGSGRGRPWWRRTFACDSSCWCCGVGSRGRAFVTWTALLCAGVPMVCIADRRTGHGLEVAPSGLPGLLAMALKTGKQGGSPSNTARVTRSHSTPGDRESLLLYRMRAIGCRPGYYSAHGETTKWATDASDLWKPASECCDGSGSQAIRSGGASVSSRLDAANASGMEGTPYHPSPASPGV
jgi:hypothetical protein